VKPFTGSALAIALITVTVTAGDGPRADVSRSQEVRARVFKMMNEGIQAHMEGRQKDAIRLLTQASSIALNSFRSYYYLGLSLKADRQYQAAIEPLQVSLELDPVNLQAHVALGDCYLMKGDPDEALAEYHRALALQNDYAPAYDGLGRAAEAAGDDEKAIQSYRKAIELNPGFPDAALNLGDLYMRDGRDAEAIELFIKAIRVRPDFAAAYNRLGVAYNRQRLGNEAIAALRQAELLEKGNPWHPVTIGGIFQDLDNLVEAGREFDTALKLDPDYLEVYLARAGLLRRQGRYDDAVAALDVGMRRDVDDPRSKARMVEMKQRLTDEAHRYEELRVRLEAQPRDAAALAALAAVKSELGDHAAAAGLLARAIEAGGSGHGQTGGGAADAALLGRLGYSALRAHMFDEAAGACEQLARLTPRDADVFINLGLAKMGLGDTAGAETALREASRLRPGDARPLAYLGNLYAMNGQRDKAIESLNASLALSGEGATERRPMQRLLDALRTDGKPSP
jgi:tetratricopeptide (TPR) repeat protein